MRKPFFSQEKKGFRVSILNAINYTIYLLLQLKAYGSCIFVKSADGFEGHILERFS